MRKLVLLELHLPLLGNKNDYHDYFKDFCYALVKILEAIETVHFIRICIFTYYLGIFLGELVFCEQNYVYLFNRSFDLI